MSDSQDTRDMAAVIYYAITEPDDKRPAFREIEAKDAADPFYRAASAALDWKWRTTDG